MQWIFRYFPSENSKFSFGKKFCFVENQFFPEQTRQFPVVLLEIFLDSNEFLFEVERIFIHVCSPKIENSLNRKKWSKSMEFSVYFLNIKKIHKHFRLSIASSNEINHNQKKAFSISISATSCSNQI